MTYLHAAFAQEGNRISIKSKQFCIVFLVLFSLLWVILRRKLDKCRIFTTQLRRKTIKTICNPKSSRHLNSYTTFYLLSKISALIELVPQYNLEQ